MTAVSSSSVWTVSKVPSIPPRIWPKDWVPSKGDSAIRSAVIATNSSHPSASLKPAKPSAPIGSSAVPSKQKYAFASESPRW